MKKKRYFFYWERLLVFALIITVIGLLLTYGVYHLFFWLFPPKVKAQGYGYRSNTPEIVEGYKFIMERDRAFIDKLDVEKRAVYEHIFKDRYAKYISKGDL